MNAASFRLLLLAGLAALVLLFLAGNRQPLPLVLFGQTLPPQPVGIWVLAAGLAGALTGAILQVLPRPRQGATPKSAKTSSRRDRERPEIRDRGSWEAANTPDWSASSSATGSTATAADADAWNIEEPPEVEGAVDPERLQRPRPERAKPRPTASPTGRDPEDEDEPEDDDPNAIDTPYRVIDPPSRTDRDA